MAGVDRFEDLNCWKLASALCDEVYRITESGPVRRDVRFRNQIRDSAASAPRNIAEGWGRYYPKQNAPYVRIANGSLEETVNHLFHGKRRKYFSRADFDKAYRLADRALRATTRYLLYLESCEKDPPRERGAIPGNQGTAHDEAPKDGRPNQESSDPLPNPDPPSGENPEAKNPEPGTQNPRTKP